MLGITFHGSSESIKHIVTEARGLKPGEAIENFKTHGYECVQVLEGRLSNEGGEVFVGDGEVEHIRLQLDLGVHLLDLELTRPGHHGAGRRKVVLPGERGDLKVP